MDGVFPRVTTSDGLVAGGSDMAVMGSLMTFAYSVAP